MAKLAVTRQNKNASSYDGIFIRQSVALLTNEMDGMHLSGCQYSLYTVIPNKEAVMRTPRCHSYQRGYPHLGRRERDRCAEAHLLTVNRQDLQKAAPTHSLSLSSSSTAPIVNLCDSQMCIIFRRLYMTNYEK
jgi:hypothetical protein